MMIKIQTITMLMSKNMYIPTNMLPDYEAELTEEEHEAEVESEHGAEVETADTVEESSATDKTVATDSATPVTSVASSVLFFGLGVAVAGVGCIILRKRKDSK